MQILDTRGVDFEYDGEMRARCGAGSDKLALYPFARLTDTANVLIMPAIHSASISTKLLQQMGGVSVMGPLLVGLEKSVQIAPLGAKMSEIYNAAMVAAYDINRLTDCGKTTRLHGRHLGWRDHSRPHRLHPHSQQEPGLRSRLGKARPYGQGGGDVHRLGARPSWSNCPARRLEVVRLPGRTPLIFIEVPGKAAGTILMYGHLDKQPEMKGWAEGTGPWMPVLKDDKLLWPRRRR